MQGFGFSEADWKLFRKRLPLWQERYMEGLIEEYSEILSSDEPASSKFWELEKRIKEDKRKTGVLARDVSRSNMKPLMVDLINEGAVTKDDLEGFSDDLKDQLIIYFEHIGLW